MIWILVWFYGFFWVPVYRPPPPPLPVVQQTEYWVPAQQTPPQLHFCKQLSPGVGVCA